MDICFEYVSQSAFVWMLLRIPWRKKQFSKLSTRLFRGFITSVMMGIFFLGTDLPQKGVCHRFPPLFSYNVTQGFSRHLSQTHTSCGGLGSSSVGR